MHLTNGSNEKMFGVSYEEFCRRKKSILVIQNNDTLRLARALVTAIAWPSKNYILPALLRSNNPVIKAQVADLCETAGVDLTHNGNRDHIQQFQYYLTDYTIVVYNKILVLGIFVYFEEPRSTNRIV